MNSIVAFIFGTYTKKERFMKKRLSLLITILFTLCLVLAGCAGGKRTSSVEGTWKIVSATEESSGLVLEGDQLQEYGFADISFEFKSKGMVTIKMNADTSEDGVYSVEDNTVKITQGATELTGEVDGTSLTITDSGLTIVLEKQ